MGVGARLAGAKLALLSWLSSASGTPNRQDLFLGDLHGCIMRFFSAGGWSILTKIRKISCRKRDLLVDAAGQEATVHHQEMAGYKTGGIGCEKYRSAAQFIQFSEPPHGSTKQEFLTALGAV
jgi:hypothetical protein